MVEDTLMMAPLPLRLHDAQLVLQTEQSAKHIGVEDCLIPPMPIGFSDD
jgi:hypothetical protein